MWRFGIYDLCHSCSTEPVIQYWLKQQVMAQETIGQTSLSKVSFTIKGVLLYSLFFEALGTVILTIAWMQEYDFAHAVFYAAFYSVSAFNNGGFSFFQIV